MKIGLLKVFIFCLQIALVCLLGQGSIFAQKKKSLNRSSNLTKAEQSYQKSIFCSDNFIFSCALENINLAIKLSQTVAKYYAQRGNIYHKLEDDEKALADFNAAIKLDTGCAMCYYSRGHLFDMQSLQSKAVKDFVEAARLEPRNDFYHIRLAHTYNSIGNYSESLKEYIKAVGIDPLNVENRKYLADFYKEQKLYDLAIAEYDKILKINRDNFTYYFNRADIYFEKGDYLNAVKDYSNSIDKSPDQLLSIELYFYRAKAYLKLRQTDKALEDLNYLISALETHYKSDKQSICNVQNFMEDYYKMRGDVFLEAGNFDYAAKNYKTIIDSCSEPYDVSVGYLGMGTLYFARNDYDKALENLNKSIELFDADAESYRLRGKIYEKMGKRNLAEKDYVMANKLTPDK